MNNLIRVKDAAAVLGLSVCTIYRMVEQETIPHVRIGRSVRFRPENIDKYLEKRAVADSVEPSEEKSRT